MDDEALRKQILIAFEYSYQHEEWITPLDEVLDGITAAQAHSVPPESEKGIWDIVLHLAVWHENIVERIETGMATHPKEGAWPSRPSTPDEAGWEAAKQRLWSSLDLVKSMLETVPIDKINASPYGLGDLFCRFTHNAYHIGQITKLTELWLTPTAEGDGQ